MKFGELHALSDVTFEVQKGEVFGLAGPNGSGKTTLFNVITGLVLGHGEVILDSEKISGLKPHQICHKGIARTFQIPAVFSTLTVKENVSVGAYFGAQLRHEREKVEEIIDFIGLKGKLDVLAANLPLMERKQTMLAIALATKPKILLLDEPLGGLSPTEIEFCLQLFGKVNKELNVTMIIIEHLMRELMGVCDRLMILHYGKQIFLGPPTKVLEDSQVKQVYLGERHA